MATGDQDDIRGRLAAVLPQAWFGGDVSTVPVWRTVLAMPARMGAWLYDLIIYARQQTRISTATGGWLDLIAFDYLGTALRRRGSQTDTAFRRRILAEVLRTRGTRPAMERLLVDLTGQMPTIFEPARPADTGVYGGPGLGYGVAGRYGSLSRPGEVLIDIRRGAAASIPNVTGYGMPAGGYGMGAIEYAGAEDVGGEISDAEILQAVVANKPAGVTVWVKING